MSSPFLTVWAELRLYFWYESTNRFWNWKHLLVKLYWSKQQGPKTFRSLGQGLCPQSVTMADSRTGKEAAMPLLPHVVRKVCIIKKYIEEVRMEETCREYPLLMYSYSHTGGCHSATLVAFLPQLVELIPLIALPSHASPFSKKDLINSLWKKTHTIQRLPF